MKEAAAKRALVIAGNIRKLRLYRNYPQDYLATKLSISQNAYSKIELGRSRITLERLFIISAILEVDPADLIRMETEELIRLVNF